MSSHPDQVYDWVVKAFQVCGVKEPPKHLILHYTNLLKEGHLSYQDVQNEFVMLTTASKSNPPNLQQNQQPTQKFDDPKLNELASDLHNLSEDKKVKEFVDQLYIHYTGKKGDPASTNFVATSIINKSYTLTQAEYFVKFSKEAKAYQKVKEQQRRERVFQFIRELYRVYLHSESPPESEVQSYAEEIFGGSRKLSDIEDEFKLQSLTAPKK